MTEKIPPGKNEESEKSDFTKTEDRLKAALEALAAMEFIMRARPLGHTPLMW